MRDMIDGVPSLTSPTWKPRLSRYELERDLEVAQGLTKELCVTAGMPWRDRMSHHAQLQSPDGTGYLSLNTRHKREKNGPYPDVWRHDFCVRLGARAVIPDDPVEEALAQMRSLRYVSMLFSETVQSGRNRDRFASTVTKLHGASNKPYKITQRTAMGMVLEGNGEYDPSAWGDSQRLDLRLDATTVDEPDKIVTITYETGLVLGEKNLKQGWSSYKSPEFRPSVKISRSIVNDVEKHKNYLAQEGPLGISQVDDDERDTGAEHEDKVRPKDLTARERQIIGQLWEDARALLRRDDLVVV